MLPSPRNGATQGRLCHASLNTNMADQVAVGAEAFGFTARIWQLVQTRG